MPAVNINHNTNGDNTIVAADGTTKMHITSLLIVAAGALTIAVRNINGSTNIIGPVTVAINGMIFLPYNPDGYGSGEGIKINLSAGTQIGGVLTYRRDRAA